MYIAAFLIGFMSSDPVQHLDKAKRRAPRDQGDQIGRIFAHRVIVYFGQIFL
jgi:hypothetical protein